MDPTFLDPRLQVHNSHWQAAAEFARQDPTLRRLLQLPLVHEPTLLQELPLQTPGIYTLVGGRQVGKSTLLKQLMQRLLADGKAPQRLAYVTCEPVVDTEELRRLLAGLLAAMPQDGLVWLLVDEVTYVDGWDRAIKFLADAGSFDRCFLLLTGSDHVLIQDSLKRLPGRRGAADVVDFQLRPLSFRECSRLHGRLPSESLERLVQGELDAELPPLPPGTLAALESELRAYHATGGYLTAINDVASAGSVRPATLRIYADWIRGDMLRLNRNEHYLREVLTAITDRYGSQLTWNTLARELSIDHPKTVADYIGLLERLDAAIVVPALSEHDHGPAPKKARKVFFSDPFVHRAVRAFVGREEVPPGSDAQLQRDLEAVMACHRARAGAVFYLKGKGEVDLAFYAGRALQLVEVKWTAQLRPEELKEIRRRGHGLIAARVPQRAEVDGIAVLPAAVVLLRLAG